MEPSNSLRLATIACLDLEVLLSMALQIVGRRLFSVLVQTLPTIVWSWPVQLWARMPSSVPTQSVPEGMYLPAGSVWFGSNGCTPTCLEQGTGDDEIQYGSLDEEDAANGIPMHASRTPTQLQMVGDDSTIRPFGKAFYLGMAQGYRVWSLTQIVAFTIFNRVGQIIFHLLPILGAIEFGAVLLYTDHPLKDMYRNSIFGSIDGYEQGENFNVDQFLWFERDFDNQGHHHTFGQVYLAIFSCFLVTHFIRVVLWLIIEISAKWFYMGRRQPGRYNYDTSSYSQRWELYQLTAKIRKLNRLNLLQFLMGTPYMNWYFRMNGGNIGKDCCLVPSWRRSIHARTGPCHVGRPNRCRLCLHCCTPQYSWKL